LQADQQRGGMQGQNEELSISLWYGNQNQDKVSIHQWLDNVQKARGRRENWDDAHFLQGVVS